GFGDRTQPQLFVRRLNELDGHPLAGTREAHSPALSPDGQWVAFIAGDELQKISIAGGSPLALCRVPNAARGVSWGADGTIVLASGNQLGAVLAVPEAGGEARAVVSPDRRPGDSGLRVYGSPSVLPGRNAVLFTIGSPGGSPDVTNLAQVAVLDRRTGEQK